MGDPSCVDPFRCSALASERGIRPSAVAIAIDKIATLARDRRGADAGQIAGARLEPEPDIVSDLGVSSWGGQDLNLRPTDYESAALTD